MGRSIAAVATSALVVVVVAGAGSSATNRPARQTDKTADAIRAINLFTPANEQAFDRLDAAIDGGGVRLAALRPQLRSGNVLRRWAAMYVAGNLANKQSDYRLLKPHLRDRNRTIRALAGFSLLAGGKKDAIPVLIEMLPYEELLQYWEPPIPIAVAADYRLSHFTGVRFKLDYASPVANRRATAARWRLWWKAVKGNIRWDRRARKYRWKKKGAAASFVQSTTAAERPAAAPPRPAALAAAVNAVSVDSNAGIVTVNLEIVRDSAVSRGDATAIRKAINNAVNFLNGPGRTGACTSIQFNIDARFKGQDPPFPAGSKPLVVKVIPGSSTDKEHKQAGQRSKVDLATNTGTWRVGDLTAPYGPTVVAHEVTHVMDLRDEYREEDKGGKLDKESYMASVVPGKVHQRHLDALAERWLKDRNAKCRKYQLTFVPWATVLEAWDQQVGNRRDYYIGRRSKANIFADFWLNPDTGQITPAGDTPCDHLDPNRSPEVSKLNPHAKQMEQAAFDKCKKEEFPQGLGGNSELFDLSANPGRLRCSLVQFHPTRKRFRTLVKGNKQGAQLSLQLEVPDSETASYVCNPSATGGFKNDITLGMRVAGALNFAIADPPLAGVSTRAFNHREAHGSAAGTAKVIRLK